MFEKIKERFKQWARTGEEVFRAKFEGKHDASQIVRSEDGTYLDPIIEAEWQKQVTEFNEDVERSFLR